MTGESLVKRLEREGPLPMSALKEKSYVAVLDAEAPQNGLVARVWLDTTLPRAFHGTWG